MLVTFIAAFGRFPALEIHSMSEGRTGSSSDLSFSTPSINLSTASDEKRDLNTTESAERPPLFDLPKEATVNTSKKVRRPDICSSSHTGEILAKESILSDKASSSCVGVDLAKADAGPTSYSSCPLKKFRTNDGIQLHSMNSNLMEAGILDLEELVNKIKWLKGLLESRTPMSGDARPSWKFVEHHFPSGNK